MKRTIHILYTVCVIGMFSMFLYLCAEFRNDVFQAREDTGFQYLTEYKSRKVEDENTPMGVKSEYVISQMNIPKGGNSLAFFSIHQNVQVYIGEELVYSVQPGKNNPFGKTPGSTWNAVPIYEADTGKDIKIVLIPVYESSVDIVPDFYFGSRVSIWVSVLERNFMSLLLGGMAVILGILFLVFGIVTRRSGADRGILMMGMFSMNIGLWKVSDSDAMALIFQHSIALSYIPFISLLLVVVPFVLYLRKLFVEEKKIWYLPCFISIAVIMVSVILQMAGVADLRQTLWMNHLVMGFVLVLAVVMLFRELHLVGWNNHLKIMVICMVSCLVGMVADIFVYYISKGASMTVMGMIGFLIYIIVLGVISVREAQRLMSIGRKAKHYEQMAYHDQLTGLYNRAAYAEDTGSPDFKMKHCILIMFDLNNLKQCNDTWGHEKGDVYIRNSAKLIHEVFGNIGKCYRMGGDEFSVLLKEVSVERCRKLVAKLKDKTDAWNRENEEKFLMQIACGYAQYDEKEDYDLGDTLRRADRMMYHEKFAMKHENF